MYLDLRQWINTSSAGYTRLDVSLLCLIDHRAYGGRGEAQAPTYPAAAVNHECPKYSLPCSGVPSKYGVIQLIVAIGHAFQIIRIHPYPGGRLII